MMDLPQINYKTKVPQIHIDHQGRTVHAFNTHYFDFILNPLFERRFFNVREWRGTCDEARRLASELKYELSYVFYDSKENMTHRGWEARPEEQVQKPVKSNWFKRLFS